MKQSINYQLTKHSLDLALNFNFVNAYRFALYRRIVDREFRFCRFDGRAYDELVAYLKNGNTNVFIPPASELKAGELYNITGRGLFIRVREEYMPYILALNCVMIRKDQYVNLLVNYAIAKYVLAHYPGFIFCTICELNSRIKRFYDSVESLDAIPEDSFFRTELVWLPFERPRKVDVSQIPDEVFSSYERARVFQEEYTTFTVDGRVGVKAWGLFTLVKPLYQAVQITNNLAYPQNEEGLWAEYSLIGRRFRSEFIYRDVEFTSSLGFVTALVGDQRVVLQSAQSSPDLAITADAEGHYGVKRGEEWIIQPEFDAITRSKDTGWYEVFKEGHYGLYSLTGACILPCAYEAFTADGNQPELFKVCCRGLWGVVGLGGVIHHPLYIAERDKEGLDAAYKATMLAYLKAAYQQHRIIPTTVIKVDVTHGYILVGLRICGLTLKIFKQHLPDGLYEQCVSNYWVAVKHLSNMALYVSDSGAVRFHYEQTQKWLEYKRRLSGYKVGSKVNGQIKNGDNMGYTVRLTSGLYGTLIPAEGKCYAVSDMLRMRIDRIDGERLYLRAVEEEPDTDS